MPMSRRSLYRAPSRSRSPAPPRGRKRSRSHSAASQERSDDRNMTQTIVRPRGGLNSNTFNFTRWTDVTSVYSTLDGTAGGTPVSALNNDVIYQGFMTLASMPGFAEFSNLFSQFKITGLEYVLINSMYTDIVTPSNGTPPNTVFPTSCKNCAVYIGSQNDILGVSAITQVQQESGVVVRDFVNMGKPLIVKVKRPTFKLDANDGPGNPQTGSADGSGWLDTNAASAVAWRGFYIAIQSAFLACGSQSTAQPMYSVRCKVSMSFRGVR